MRVTGLAPDDTMMVSEPRNKSVVQAYGKAKPLVTWMTPKDEWKCASPGASGESRAFPKRKLRSIPSIRAMSWQCSLCPRAKIEHCELNSRPFWAVFSGIDRV